VDIVLLDIWKFLIDPGKMTGALAGGIGAILLGLLLLLYPFSKDT
jgi:hypothetical protein